MLNRTLVLSYAKRLSCVLFLCGVSLPSHVVAQPNAILTSDAVVHRAGLVVEWTSHAPVAASSELIDWELLIDENQATTTIEVRAGNRREVISQYDRNPRGDILGVAGAEKLAQDRRDYMLAELAARGKKDVEVTIEKFQQPKAMLIIMTGSGDVAALDANTGKTQWLSRVGSARSPGIGVGVGVDHVAVVRGSFLYVLETSTGKELWSKQCKYAVGSSPAVADGKVMVPLTDGRLEVFSIEAEGIGSYALMALGEGTAQPLVTSRTVSWPTTRGELNVMARDRENHAIKYRLRSDQSIVSQATTDGEKLYVGSLDGFLYAIDEVRGSVDWTISLGVGITESPVPLGDYVYAISGDKKLYRILAGTGELAPGWEDPMDNISRYVGASETNLYLMDSFGSLVVVDRATKAITDRLEVGQIDLVLNNYQNDRLYIASKTGAMQCLREIKSERPFYHHDEVTEKMMAGSQTKEGAEGSGTKDAAAGSNPFAGAGAKAGETDKGSGGRNPFANSGDVDPFGADSSGAAGSDGSGTKDESEPGDPFGGSDDNTDPFGGSDAEPDPFGGSSEDPFGGSSDSEDPFG